MSKPYSILQVTPLPVLTTEYLDDTEKENKPKTCYETIGGILFDTKYAWASNGPRFTLFNSKTGTKVAAWTFGSVVGDSSTRVVCVDELRRPVGKLPLLVIGLECDLTGGMICIFDVTGSRVLRSIQINNKVTSLHVIDASYDVCPLPGPLRAFDGILSVGTTDGNVFLLDICRQTCEEALSGVGLGDIRDEISSCQIKTIFLGDIYSLELHKQVAIKNSEHLCIHLNATNSATQHFVLKGPKGEDRVYVNKIEVLVSALHYCPQLGSLLVGYNFGAWQLWNLINLQLVYTSPIYEENIPVSHFAIQEPCDDPRAFCYVWAVYSNTEPYETGLPVAVLYSLNYDSKEWHEGYGILYQDLTSCAVRFQTDLMLLGEKEIKTKNVQQGARCLRIQAINKAITKDSFHEGQEEMLTLCSIIWSEWKSDSNTEPSTFMSLFDLNQWYKEQMPSSPRSEEFERYMTRVCLSDLLHAVNPERIPFLDVRLDVNTISQFSGSQKLEEHYYPSSLAFQLCALRKCDVSIFNNQGSQRALLSQLEFGGPLTLFKPIELFNSSVNLGLSPLFIDILGKVSSSIEYQREFLLNIALEQQLLGWLCRCAVAWGTGSHSATGCTLHFLLTWGWQRAQVLKQNADKLSMPLFDYSGLRLDANTHNLLSNCARQLKNLATLFKFVIQKYGRFMINLDMIKQQGQSLQMVSVHLEVLQWLLNVGLLPECPLSSYPRTDEFSRISAPYPVDDLIQYYNQRRTSLQTLNAEQFSTSGSLLFIDNLVDLECGGHKLQKQWENDGGSGLYPPPSLQALMRTYLIENVDISYIHCVTIYVFLDLAMTLDQSRYKSTITHLIKFPAVFRLSPSVIKITQAFWQLDHGDFATAMEQLLDPLVCNKDLKMWHHRIALKALLSQEQHNFALLYLQVKHPAVTEVQDLCTVLSLYVANNMLDEAFHFQRRSRNIDNEAELLRHFYQEYDQKNKISSILHLPLTQIEEAAFMKYLEDIDHPQLKDLKVMYYIQNSRYMDAVETNTTFNAVKMENKGLHGQENANFRELILNGLTGALPEISKSLMNLCCNEKDTLWKEVKRPEPFSVFVHNTNEQVKYKSTMIHAGLIKAKEIWTSPVINISTVKDKSHVPVSISCEQIPFVNTPKALRTQTKTTTPMIYPKMTKLYLEQDDDGPSPPKRFKPSPRAPVTSPETQKSIRVETINEEITSSNLSVKLDTPIVKRKTPKRSASLRTSGEQFSVGTPQSILKIRSLVRNSESPELAIDSSTPDNTVSSNKKLISNVHDKSVNVITVASPKRSSLGLTPRKALPRTPRPAVRFDISRTPSECSLTSNSSEPTYEIIRDKALVHSPLEGVQKEIKEFANTSASQQSKLEANSETTSPSTEEVFYTPDVSSNCTVDSKETSQVNINIESDESKVLNQQVPKESVNVIMTRGRLSLIDSETKSSDTKETIKRKMEDSASAKTTQASEISSADDFDKNKNMESVPASPKTPRSRRSYKGTLPEAGIRSSPRLRKSLQAEIQQLESVDKNLDLLLKDRAEKHSGEASQQPFEEASTSGSANSPSSFSNIESPIKSRLRGRRSLSRQVLESNAFSKLADSPTARKLQMTESPLPAQNVSQLEISYSKSEIIYECNSLDNTQSVISTTEEYKDSFVKSKDTEISEHSSQHQHEQSQYVLKEDILEEIYEAGSSLMDVSSVNVTENSVADSGTPETDENKEVVSSTFQASTPISYESKQKDDKDILEQESEKLITSTENIETVNDDNKEGNIEADNKEASIEAVNIYDDLSNDNYRSIDPEMNVFEMTDDLDLNQGIYVENSGNILEMDTGYTTNDDKVFADECDVLSDVIAINESSEKADSSELNKAIIEESNVAVDTAESKDTTETENKLDEGSVEIIELNTSSDNSEQEIDSEESSESSYNSQSENDYEDNEEQSHSEEVDVSSNASTLIIQEQLREDITSESSSSDPVSTSDDNDTDSRQSKTSEYYEQSVGDEDNFSEPEQDVTTYTQLEVIPEEPQIESAEEILQTAVLDDNLENTDISTKQVSESITQSQVNVLEEILNIAKDDNQEDMSGIHLLADTVYEITEETNQFDVIPEEISEVEVVTTESHISKEVSEPVIVVEDTLNTAKIGQESVTITEEIDNEADNSDAETIKLDDQALAEKQEISSSEVHDENTKSENNQQISSSASFEPAVVVTEVKRYSEKDILSKTDILDDTPGTEQSLNITYGRDILDESANFGPTSTPRPSMGIKDIFDKSEFYSSKGSSHPLSQTDIPDITKSRTPGKRTRRLSSLQATSTPDMPLRRSTRRSASFSFSQGISSINEPSTSKASTSTANFDQPSTSKQSSSVDEANTSHALPSRRKRSTSVDIKQLPSKKRSLRSASTDVEKNVEEHEVEATPVLQKRKAKSVIGNLSRGDEVKIKNEANNTKTKDDEMSTQLESMRKQKHPLNARKSKSIVIISATKTKLEEYSTARRLTRKQASLVERTLGTTNVDIKIANLQEHLDSDSDDSDYERGPNIDKINPIHLLDKPEFEGKPDSDEEKAINKSPASSVPESPIGSRLRTRSSISNNSPRSDTSTVYSLSEAGPSKQKLRSVKRVIIESDANIASRTRQRSKSTDEAFIHSEDKSSPPKLRKTRQRSKDSDSSIVSQTRSLIDSKKGPVLRKRTLSVADQPVTMSPRKNEKHARLKSELPKIIEEQVESQSSRRTRNSKKN